MLILESSIIPSLSSSGWNKENLNIIRLSPLPWLAQDFPTSFPESPISGNPLPPGQSVTLPVTCQVFRLSCFTVWQWNTYMIFRTSHVLCVTCQFIHRMSFHCPKAPSSLTRFLRRAQCTSLLPCCASPTRYSDSHLLPTEDSGNFLSSGSIFLSPLTSPDSCLNLSYLCSSLLLRVTPTSLDSWN